MFTHRQDFHIHRLAQMMKQNEREHNLYKKAKSVNMSSVLMHDIGCCFFASSRSVSFHLFYERYEKERKI